MLKPFDITQPDYLIGPADNTFSGYAYDASGVDSLTLDLTAPTGDHSSPACPGADVGGSWRCTWDATQANGGTAPADGDIFTARLQATDSLAQTSPQSAARTFVVDAAPPTLTLAITESTPVVNGNSYRLTGSLADNRGLGAVEVCWADTGDPTDCAAATLNLVGGRAPVVYTDTASTPLPIDGTTTCDGNELVRPFTVTQDFTVGQVALDFQAEHTYRDDVLVDLQAPDGTEVRVLFGQGGVASTQQNYNVALADSALHGLYASRYDDDLNAAPRDVRPYEPLRAFAGVDAEGVWMLRICDTAPWFDDGAYHASRLTLTPRGEDVAPRTGAWAYNLPLPAEQDGVTHTLHIYATDLVGNRSLTTLDLVVDNVGPVITVTEALNAGVWNTAARPVLKGEVADMGGEVIFVTVSVQAPDGDWYTEAITHNTTTWQYDLTPTVGGVHTLWITAQDAAGNQTVTQPYQSTVLLPPTIYKTVTPLYASLGGVVTYTLAVRNRNPDSVHGVVVADPLPEGLTPSGTADGTAYIPLPGKTLVWPSFDLGGHETAYLEFAATVTTDTLYYGSVITNVAYLTTTESGGSVSNVAPLLLEPAPPDYEVYLPLVLRQ